MSERIQIGGRSVYISDRHHEVLPDWVEAFHTNQAALPLITFDYHTDLHRAFISYASIGRKAGTDAEMLTLARERLAKVDVGKANSIRQAVRDLRHDQHIDCAIGLGIVSHAYVFLGRDAFGMAHDRATVFKYDPCAPDCSRSPHGEECERPKADMVIDDSVLTPRVAILEDSISLEDPYILDIDLDVFSTFAAIQPTSRNEFHRLIRKATIMTVAREKGCVENLRLDEKLSVEFLESELFQHIADALAS